MDTPAPTLNESTTLYYRQGSSDKIYQVAVEASGDGFVVTFAYGRRGSTLSTGAKTADPVPLAQAMQIYSRLVKEKTTKGYARGESGSPYQHTDKAGRATGVLPQLLNAVEECDTPKYIADAQYWAQEKFDGRRVLIRRAGDSIIGINRLGLMIDLPEPIAAHARQLQSQQWLIDGEALGETFHAFDALESAGVDLRVQPYVKRTAALTKIVGQKNDAAIRLVETAKSADAKQGMLGRLKGANKEGIVFKRHLAPHTPGRPASGGDWLKVKFTATASCIVAKTHGGKRSVGLELIDGGRRVGVGNVTIPVNHAIPEPGRIIDVRYLYAYPGGSLCQPVYLCRRDDVRLEDCRLSQLKLKAITGDGDDL